MTWRPDPSFYPSPRMAMKAAPEKLAYVAAFDPTRQKPDAIAIVDLEPGSSSYSQRTTALGLSGALVLLG
jgi:methanethiol oxidase